MHIKSRNVIIVANSSGNVPLMEMIIQSILDRTDYYYENYRSCNLGNSRSLANPLINRLINHF